MNRRLLVAAGLIVAIGVGLLAFALVRSFDDSGSPTTGAAATLQRIVAAAEPARSPFTGLTATKLAVGGKCLDVVVADTEAERVEGLRQRSDIGPYDAMLFAFDQPSDVGFTMSTVPVPLEIGFYAADGTRGSSQHMLPCPKAESECPVYRADGPFTYALETLSGKLPVGALSGCSTT